MVQSWCGCFLCVEILKGEKEGEEMGVGFLGGGGWNTVKIKNITKK